MGNSDKIYFKVCYHILDILCLTNVGHSVKTCLIVKRVLHWGHSGTGWHQVNSDMISNSYFPGNISNKKTKILEI